MAERMAVNPNRMELLRLRRRLQIARRGHRLLKEKFDELMKRFQQSIAETTELRRTVEERLETAFRVFAMARAEASLPELEEALRAPTARAEVRVTRAVVVSVPVTELELDTGGRLDSYGLATTPSLLDEALELYSSALPLMVRMAAGEAAVKVLAGEIERTRRRVNALEYILIPRLLDTVRFITMKLDEAERANITRLMKIKGMATGEAGRL